MKRIILLIAIIISSLSQQLSAQIGISVNIGRQPSWGPVGYDYVENYYIPALNVYYNVPRGVYVYNSGGRWIQTTYLPARYSNYDLHNVYKVVVNKPSPWLNNNYYVTQYSGYRSRPSQVVIRNSNDYRYKSRNYGGYRREHDERRYDYDRHDNDHHDNGRGHGHGHGRGHDKD